MRRMRARRLGRLTTRHPSPLGAGLQHHSGRSATSRRSRLRQAGATTRDQRARVIRRRASAATPTPARRGCLRLRLASVLPVMTGARRLRALSLMVRRDAGCARHDRPSRTPGACRNSITQPRLARPRGDASSLGSYRNPRTRPLPTTSTIRRGLADARWWVAAAGTTFRPNSERPSDKRPTFCRRLLRRPPARESGEGEEGDESSVRRGLRCVVVYRDATERDAHNRLPLPLVGSGRRAARWGVPERDGAHQSKMS